MPLNQQIEGGDGKRQPGLQIVDHPMHHFLGMADQRQHGEHGLDQHSVVPGSARAELEVGWITVGGMKPGVGQDQHAILEHLNQRMKQCIVDVGRRPQPTDNAPHVIDQQAEFLTHDPAMVGDPFTTDLPGTEPFPNRMDQFDAVTVDHPQQRGLGQKPQGPLAVGNKRPKQASPLGQARKQGAIISCQPAVESSVTDPLRVCRIPSVTTSLGHRHAWGCFGNARIASSIRQNRSVIKSILVWAALRSLSTLELTSG